MKETIKKFIPTFLLSFYHLVLAYLGVMLFDFPSSKLFVVGVTGTKGKSTVTELIFQILSEAGRKTALANTIRFAIGSESKPNLFKMTMPGRFFLQRFLRRAVSAGATHAVVEMTSEGAAQHRQKGIELDALVFTNLAPEHLESHGGLEHYKQAKLSLAKHLEKSSKRPRIIVANADDEVGKEFLKAEVEVRASFSLKDAEPYTIDDKSVRLVWRRIPLVVPLPGLFNLKNILAALTFGKALDIPTETMKRALEHIKPIAGRAERVVAGQPFEVVIDYAHTPDSLRALYGTYRNKRLVCVLGATGGGRDRWKRPEMGKVADEFCDLTIITNEDPYDEDPQNIIEGIARGFVKHKPRTILDRREAIRNALKEAREGDMVLITGKGTDPYLMGPRGTKQPWSDRKVAQEELKKLGYN